MKKIYLSICAIAVVVTSFAQQSRMENDNLIAPSKQIINNTPTNSSSSAPATIIWQNECDNAADWTFTNSSIPPLDWHIEMGGDASIPVNSNGPTGFTTVSNGYLFIDSDGTGGGDNDGTPVICEVTTANMIDCSAWPYIELTFSHNYRWWQDTRGVRVSGDGGASWTEFEITDVNGYPNLQNSGNPEISVYNISSVCGSQDSVMVQFYFDDNDIWAWYWAVDDVMISEIPDNSMNISDAVQGGWWQTYLTAGGDGYDYTFKPQSQLTGNPYAFEAVLRNAGLAPQNTTLHVEVKDGTGTVVFSDVSNTLLLDLSFPQDTFVINSTFAPTTNGVYEITMWGDGDSVSTNSVVLYTEVTDYEYGRDTDQLPANGSWRVGRDCGGMVLAVKYDIYDDITLHSIQAHISDQSSVGTTIFAALYEDDPAGDPIYLTQTDDFTITSAHLGNWITLPFDVGEQLFSGGSGYYAAVSGYASPVDSFSVSVSGESQGGTRIQDNGRNIGSQGFGYWYTISDVPMIRMGVGATVDIEDNVLNGEFNVYPNPNNGIFIVELNNVRSDDYLLTVTNVLGQTVYTSSVKSNGLTSETIDLSDFDKGVYLLEISNSTSTISEKIIVE